MFNIPRGLNNDKTTQAEEGAHDTLQSERNAPGIVILDVAAAVIDPDRCGVTDNVSCKLNAGQLSSIVRRRNLGLVNRHDSRECTNAKTGNETAGHHHRHRSSQCLECTSDEEDARTVENSPSSSDNISNATDHQ
ncbi:unnamed protein product [Fusarium graminearum]|nr:unnamed protein product [Fusarium graminearum]VTO93496.1 unnamed protein product [Fusarium graminearum]